MTRPFPTCLVAVLCLATSVAHAADPVSIADPAALQAEKGIWAAIAISPQDGRHGFFWGADKRGEAEVLSLEHCANAGGEACQVLEVFRNHRHWDDDDGTGFPYQPCGALATDGDAASSMTRFGSATATTRREAELGALNICQSTGAQCRIREWVCT